MLHTIITILLGIVATFFGAITYYALKRINTYEELIITFDNTVEAIKHQLKLIDHKGTFESDDEVGFFFEEIKQLGNQLGELFETEVDDEKTQEEK